MGALAAAYGLAHHVYTYTITTMTTTTYVSVNDTTPTLYYYITNCPLNLTAHERQEDTRVNTRHKLNTSQYTNTTTATPRQHIKTSTLCTALVEPLGHPTPFYKDYTTPLTRGFEPLNAIINTHNVTKHEEPLPRTLTLNRSHYKQKRSGDTHPTSQHTKKHKV
jgi:hypothetical protein